ncbi:Hypothetical protein EAG7_00928 [Klebsiella aerogenes]|nr:Hypothetical protein EAG7_00928 [Klebsiella aerogenes]PVF77654.1 hypothetical protein CSC18_2278 [Klebsiella aerogenes]
MVLLALKDFNGWKQGRKEIASGFKQVAIGYLEFYVSC